jgi:hypothetical protein
MKATQARLSVRGESPFFRCLNVAAEEVAEKVGSRRILVAQAECLCYFFRSL